MSKPNKLDEGTGADNTGTDNTETKAEVKRESPVVVIPIFKDDAKAMGFEVGEKDTKQNSEIRAKARELMKLPVRVRTSGVQAQLKTKLGLKDDATPSEVNKAMREYTLKL